MDNLKENNKFYKRKSTYSSLIFVLAMTGVSCTGKVEIFREEAKNYCAVHNPTIWMNSANKSGLTELQQQLDDRINQVIKTEEFRQVVDELNQVKFIRDLYGTAQSKISTLTHEEWICPEYKQFYTINYERVTDYPSSDADESKAVIITIDATGVYTVNEKMLSGNNPSTLTLAIETALASSSTRVIIKTEKNTPKQALDTALRSISSIGVRNATIIKP